MGKKLRKEMRRTEKGTKEREEGKGSDEWTNKETVSEGDLKESNERRRDVERKERN
jgi:hypothetical protein